MRPEDLKAELEKRWQEPGCRYYHHIAIWESADTVGYETVPRAPPYSIWSRPGRRVRVWQWEPAQMRRRAIR